MAHTLKFFGRSPLVWIALLWLVAMAPTASAQVRPDRVPQDALFYAEFAGLDEMTRMQGTHYAGLMAQSSFDELLRSLPGMFLQMLAMEDPRAAQVAAGLQSSMDALISGHTTLYIGPLALPSAKAALVLRVGEGQVAAVHDELSGLLEAIPGVLQLKRGADYVALTTPILRRADLACLGLLDDAGADDAGAEHASVEAAPSLAADPRYTQHAREASMAALWVDLQGILQIVEQLGPMSDPSFPEMFQQFLAFTGVGGLREVVAQAGFVGSSWQTELFVGAPAEARVGLLKMLGGGGIADENLAAIPATAASAGGVSLDLPKLLNACLSVMDFVEPPPPEDPSYQLQLQVAMDELSQDLGIDVRSDLLGALGTDWVYYADRQVGGTGLFSSVLIHTPKKPAALQRSFAAISELANRELQRAMEGEDLSLKVRALNERGVDFLVFDLPGAAPCVAFHEGRMIAALHPNVVLGAIHSGFGGPRLVENTAFAEARAASVQSPRLFCYSDLPNTVPDAYAEALVVPQLLGGFEEMLGLSHSPLVIPPLYELTDFLEPSTTFSYCDDAGMHLRCQEPFPGSVMLTAARPSALFGTPTVVLYLVGVSMWIRVESADRPAGIMMDLQELGYLDAEEELVEVEVVVEDAAVEVVEEEAEGEGGGSQKEGGGGR